LVETNASTKYPLSCLGLLQIREICRIRPMQNSKTASFTYSNNHKTSLLKLVFSDYRYHITIRLSAMLYITLKPSNTIGRSFILYIDRAGLW